MVNILNALPGIVLSFVIIVFLLGMGATMIGSLQEEQCEDADGIYWNGLCVSDEGGTVDNVSNYALNASLSGLEGIENMADWTPTLGLAIMIGVVVAVLVGFLGFAIGGRTGA